MKPTTPFSNNEISGLTPDEQADAEFDAAIKRYRLRKEAGAGVNPLRSKEKTGPELQPPFNHQGQRILQMLKWGMDPTPRPEKMNKRASELQAAIEDFQQAMNPQED